MKDVILAAVDITIIGMGFVIGFLIVFSLSTKLMSVVVQKISKAKTPPPEQALISEEARFVIKDAIKQHIKNV